MGVSFPLLGWERSGKETALELLQEEIPSEALAGLVREEPATPAEQAPSSPEDDERAARRSLRAQIDKLERDLAEAFVTAYPMGGLHDAPAPSYAAPRLLDLGELERVRDDLAARLRAARATITELADRQADNRVRLERMLLEPGRYRYVRIANRDLGEPGCGVWQVRPRLGLIGMLMGWWQVKLSSGCPLATAAASPRPSRSAGPSGAGRCP